MRHRLLAWIALGFVLVGFAFLAKPLSMAAKPFDPAAPPMTFTVTTVADTGAGSLRDAINQANTTAGADLINFAPGIGTIVVGTVTGLPLPAITEAVTIDGGVERVELDGSSVSLFGNGLTIMATGVTVRNLVINRFPGAGVSIQGDGNSIQGSLIGTDSSGTAALANTSGGLLVIGANNAIGGTTPAARNVISGNDLFGILFTADTAHDNAVLGNFIGTDVTGANPVPNTGSGVRLLEDAFNNAIGGSAPGARNTIAFNAGSGVLIAGGSGNSILSNSIFNNAALGIDLSDDAAVTPNDQCDVDSGPNNLENFPVVTSAQTFGGSTAILGTLNSSLSSTFRIEFFSNSACDPSGNGEGETFLGSTNVTTGGCDGTINVVLGVPVTPGKVVTATATDQFGNTSEFSKCVTVVPASSCTITCPASITAATGAGSTSCGVPIQYPPPTAFGPCGSVICSPPAGSLFPVGSTFVSCSEAGGAICSFEVTVIDNTAPELSCVTGVTVKAPPDQSSIMVTYPAPNATDNCGAVDTSCSPPSGSTFPLGATLVTCRGVDSSSNVTYCFLTVSVVDAEAPRIICPQNVSVVPPAGQNSAVVTYPPPTITDNLPGATFSCSPSSGSTFPVGVTLVTCTASDLSGNKASCSFTVSVGRPAGKVTIPGGKAALEFGDPVPVGTSRKPKKNKNNPCSAFSIENAGFAPLVLALDSIQRVGADVNSGKITDPDDSRYFTVYLANPDQPQTALNLGAELTIQPQATQSFCVRFNALLPALAGKTTGLQAAQVLPDTMNSRVAFKQIDGDALTVPILSHVGTALTLIDPLNPRRPPSVSFTRSGNKFTVSYAAHDSNLDLTRARYEFLTASGQVIGEAFELDLSEPLRALNLVRGQSVGISQDFTGANDHPEVAAVRLTVFDGDTSVTATASVATSTSSLQLLNRTQGITLYLPSAKLGPSIPQ